MDSKLVKVVGVLHYNDKAREEAVKKVYWDAQYTQFGGGEEGFVKYADIKEYKTVRPAGNGADLLSYTHGIKTKYGQDINRDYKGNNVIRDEYTSNKPLPTGERWKWEGDYFENFEKNRDKYYSFTFDSNLKRAADKKVVEQNAVATYANNDRLLEKKYLTPELTRFYGSSPGMSLRVLNATFGQYYTGRISDIPEAQVKFEHDYLDFLDKTSSSETSSSILSELRGAGKEFAGGIRAGMLNTFENAKNELYERGKDASLNTGNGRAYTYDYLNPEERYYRGKEEFRSDFSHTALKQSAATKLPDGTRLQFDEGDTIHLRGVTINGRHISSEEELHAQFPLMEADSLAFEKQYGFTYDSKSGDDTAGNFKTPDNSKHKSLLTRTNELFVNHKISTMAGRFHTSSEAGRGNDETDTASNPTWGNSHGRSLLAKNTNNKTNGYENPYCRAWTYHHQYDKVTSLIRPFKNGGTEEGEGGYTYNSVKYNENGDVIKSGQITESSNAPVSVTDKFHDYYVKPNDSVSTGSQYLERNSVLNRKTGFVNITPKGEMCKDNTVQIKNCMFSIENLAWKDVPNKKNYLSKEQRGPNGGRIMWFPPYGLDFNESVTVNWNQSNFIGRGESVYTYTNTVRQGTLSFDILIDHPAIIDNIQKYGADKIGSAVTEEDILRYFAGCEVPQSLVWRTPECTPYIEDEEEEVNEPEVITSEDDGEESCERIKFYVYFPDNYSGNLRPMGKEDMDRYGHSDAYWFDYLKLGRDGYTPIDPIDDENGFKTIGPGYEMDWERLIPSPEKIAEEYDDIADATYRRKYNNLNDEQKAEFLDQDPYCFTYIKIKYSIVEGDAITGVTYLALNQEQKAEFERNFAGWMSDNHLQPTIDLLCYDEIAQKLFNKDYYQINGQQQEEVREKIRYSDLTPDELDRQEALGNELPKLMNAVLDSIAGIRFQGKRFRQLDGTKKNEVYLIVKKELTEKTFLMGSEPFGEYVNGNNVARGAVSIMFPYKYEELDEDKKARVRDIAEEKHKYEDPWLYSSSAVTNGGMSVTRWDKKGSNPNIDEYGEKDGAITVHRNASSKDTPENAKKHYAEPNLWYQHPVDFNLHEKLRNLNDEGRDKGMTYAIIGANNEEEVLSERISDYLDRTNYHLNDDRYEIVDGKRVWKHIPQDATNSFYEILNLLQYVSGKANYLKDSLSLTFRRNKYSINDNPTYKILKIIKAFGSEVLKSVTVFGGCSTQSNKNAKYVALRRAITLKTFLMGCLEIPNEKFNEMDEDNAIIQAPPKADLSVNSLESKLQKFASVEILYYPSQISKISNMANNANITVCGETVQTLVSVSETSTQSNTPVDGTIMLDESTASDIDIWQRQVNEVRQLLDAEYEERRKQQEEAEERRRQAEERRRQAEERRRLAEERIVTGVTRYETEAEYFKRIEKDDPILHKNIVNKFKYFSPAFHSMSPEGFNARLTFLQQCTRQGHTISASDTGFAKTAGNLAFGRMPVCVLRIGDFINTKILINSLSINYGADGAPQWDLNPEGIGVQPMYAKIQMGITILGGQSLDGPINRLQNAVSFNYYANTGVYDDRSDRLLLNGAGNLYEETTGGRVVHEIQEGPVTTKFKDYSSYAAGKVNYGHVWAPYPEIKVQEGEGAEVDYNEWLKTHNNTTT